ncbi:MAG: N-acetyltransferase family protein [Cyanobacteriota bacterium]|nr:N-acetyltransferase family protein [Cyanobacteriota bacterium]
MSLLKIRMAVFQDYPAIASIYNEAVERGGITMDGRPYNVDDIQAIADKMGDREILLVAQTPEKAIGWGIVKRYSDRIGYQVCCETSIYLTFSETGKGYGGVLQKALMDKVADYGYYHIVAKILAANQGSIRFHQQFGFEIVGIQKDIGLVNGVWHDVAILQYLFPKGASEVSKNSFSFPQKDTASF